jgi:hypothetical protein
MNEGYNMFTIADNCIHAITFESHGEDFTKVVLTETIEEPATYDEKGWKF